MARYAEDNPTGEATNKAPRNPHAYRDWVIRAFNDDLPYDEFVRRQLAADLMPALPRSEIAALGFIGLAPVYHKEPKLSAEVIATIVADEWDERVDTITRGFLGLTVACARCHDHKFDPIGTADYYALAGVMASTQLVDRPLVPADPEAEERLASLRAAIADVELRLGYAKEKKGAAAKEKEDGSKYDRPIADFEARLKALKATRAFDGPTAPAVRDAGLWVDGGDPSWTALDYRPGTSRDLPVFLRGNAATPGPIVPRHFPSVLSPGEPRSFGAGSGRKELAEGIVGDAGSLGRPGDRQPGLGLALRPPAGDDPEQLRQARRTALAPRAARRPGRPVHRRGVVAEGAAPRDRPFEHLPPVEPGRRLGPVGRPREQMARAGALAPARRRRLA